MDLFGGSVIVILLILDTTTSVYGIGCQISQPVCTRRERGGGGVDAFKVQKKI